MNLLSSPCCNVRHFFCESLNSKLSANHCCNILMQSSKIKLDLDKNSIYEYKMSIIHAVQMEYCCDIHSGFFFEGFTISIWETFVSLLPFKFFQTQQKRALLIPLICFNFFLHVTTSPQCFLWTLIGCHYYYIPYFTSKIFLNLGL